MVQGNIFFNKAGGEKKCREAAGVYCLLCFQGSGVLGVFRFLR